MNGSSYPQKVEGAERGTSKASNTREIQRGARSFFFCQFLRIDDNDDDDDDGDGDGIFVEIAASLEERKGRLFSWY